jgi:hypothetical protein
MKTLILCSALALFIPLNSSDAQSKQNEDDSEIQSDDFGDRIGNEIEKFVDHMTRRWDFRDNDEKYAEEDTVSKKRRRSLTITDTEIDDSAHSFSGDKVIEASETITGNVVVKGGDLTVYGIIDGDVMVVGGDLQVKSTGKITGNARVINGNIIKEDGAVIEGYEDKTSSTTAGYREHSHRFTRSGRTFDVPWLSEQTNLDKFIVRYNRVEGVFLGFGTEKKYYWDGNRSWNSYGSLGWGFKSHTWRGNLGLSRQFAMPSEEANHLFEIGVEGYSLTDSKDQWIINQLENSLYALLIHEDFRDYYERNGVTIHAAYYSQVDYFKTELKITYIADKVDSLNNKVNWAFFGGGKWFRINPVIQPGTMRSVMLSGGLSTITKTAYGPEGWSLYATSEMAKRGWGSEFNFDQYVFDVKRFQPIGRYDNINFRLRVGTSDGMLPMQKTFDLGGLGTMNAFPFKSEIGNRMLLMNAEYIINGSFLDDLEFWPTWLFQHFNIIISSDVGFTRSVPSHTSPIEGFSGIMWSEFKHDFGVGIANRSGSFRMGITWRTDHPKPAQFIFRIYRPF